MKKTPLLIILLLVAFKIFAQTPVIVSKPQDFITYIISRDSVQSKLYLQGKDTLDTRHRVDSLFQRALANIKTYAVWDSISNKPSTFPPSAHTHPISEVINLQSELDRRVTLNDTQTITGLKTFYSVPTYWGDSWNSQASIMGTDGGGRGSMTLNNTSSSQYFMAQYNFLRFRTLNYFQSIYPNPNLTGNSNIWMPSKTGNDTFALQGDMQTLLNQRVYYTSSVSNLSSISAVAGAVIVTDSLTGGLFTYTTGTADGFMTFNASGGGVWKRVVLDKIYPEWFGAKGDGSTDDGSSFQGMFDWIKASSSRDYIIGFKSRLYLINTTVNWPNTIPNTGGSTGQTIRVEGYGVTIKTTSSITIFSRVPTGQSNAASIISDYRFSIAGITFIGNQTSGQKAIALHSFYSPEIKNCNFYSFDTAIVKRFWLKGSIDNCMFTNNVSVAILGASGDIWGGTTSNSAYNINMITNCRIFNTSTTYASIMLLASDGTTVKNTVSEGAAPRYNFYVDYQGSTVVNQTLFESIWCESSGPAAKQGTNFYLRTKGTTIIKNLTRTLQDTLFYIDNTGAAGQTIIFDNIPYMGNLAAKCFNGSSSTLSGTVLMFENMGVINPNLIFDTAKWVGGVIPVGATLFNNLPANSGWAVTTSGDINLTPNYTSSSNGYVYVKGLIVPVDGTGTWGRRGGTNQRPASIWSMSYKVDTTGAYEFNTVGARDVWLSRLKATVLWINADGGTLMSKGNTAARGLSPVSGIFRWNTDSTGIEVWDGTAWRVLATTKYVNDAIATAISTHVSGTYTPTLTNQTNLTSSSLNSATYMRIGNIVHVAASFNIQATASSTNTVLRFTVPSGGSMISGTGVGLVNGGNGTMNGVSWYSNTDIQISFVPNNTGAITITVQFDYSL